MFDHGVSLIFGAVEVLFMMTDEARVYRKKYVDVEVAFRSDGLMLPRALVWDDGRRYEIDMTVYDPYRERFSWDGADPGALYK